VVVHAGGSCYEPGLHSKIPTGDIAQWYSLPSMPKGLGLIPSPNKAYKLCDFIYAILEKTKLQRQQISGCHWPREGVFVQGE
jgi:hypothetical protein